MSFSKTSNKCKEISFKKTQIKFEFLVLGKMLRVMHAKKSFLFVNYISMIDYVCTFTKFDAVFARKKF